MDSTYSFQYDFIKGSFHVCSVCSYAWRSRSSGRDPRSCPGCGSRLWKESYPHHCMNCGFHWVTSKPQPKKCPECQSLKWNGGKTDTVPLGKTDTAGIFDMYDGGMGAVSIARTTGLVFSDVYDTLRAVHSDETRL